MKWMVHKIGVMLLIALIAVTLAQVKSNAQNTWHIAKGPLMTRWDKQVSPANAWPDYPRPQLVRKTWENLNGLWEYAITDPDAPQPTSYDGQILVPYPIESALSGVMKMPDPKDYIWYHRTFDIPKTWENKRILLHFGAVNWQATVYVNGEEIGSHTGAYDGFTFDITDALHSSGAQSLVVKVYAPIDNNDIARGKQTEHPGGIFYTPSSGIWQTVWLEPVARTYISSLQLVPDVDAGVLHFKANVRGDHADSAKVLVTPVEGDKKLETKTCAVNEDVEIPIPNAHLWSPSDPFLYDLKVSLVKDGKVVDNVRSYFAMRKIAVSSDGHVMRLMLNNHFLFEMGVLDQGFWPDGLYTAPTDSAIRYDLEMVKKCGFNLIRKHVKVEPERWYYWADKLGLLVWQDMPSCFDSNPPPAAAAQFKTELHNMVVGRGNHPCIIMWVVFNEGWGQHDTRSLVSYVKNLDPSRLVDDASGWTDKGVGDVIDMHHYQEPESPKPESNRAAVLGEFGGLGMRVNGHMWTNESWGYAGLMSQSARLERRYQQLLKMIPPLIQNPGLSAAVYTQLTDVETESNGLMTYDRAVTKMNPKIVADANAFRFPYIPIKTDLVPTSLDKPIIWRYTTTQPNDNWYQVNYDDGAWQSGPAGFGAGGVCPAIRTPWTTSDIWIRRTFTLPNKIPENLVFRVFHDEDVEIYLNGVFAGSAKGYTTDYVDLQMTPQARAALKPGENVIAAHCHQTIGGQYIDIGITDASLNK
jgi:hypothetical protein